MALQLLKVYLGLPCPPVYRDNIQQLPVWSITCSIKEHDAHISSTFLLAHTVKAEQPHEFPQWESLLLICVQQLQSTIFLGYMANLAHLKPQLLQAYPCRMRDGWSSRTTRAI